MKNIIFAVLVGLCFICCCSKKQTNIEANQNLDENIQSTYKSIYKTFNSNYKEKKYEVVTQQSDFDKIKSILNLENDLKVNFSKSNVVILNMAERNTGGFDIQVVGLIEESDKLILRVKEVSPKPYDMVTMAFTTPLEIIEINSKKTIEISVE